MRPIDAAIVETLQGSGPCNLDDVVTSLSVFSWGKVFDSVARLSRDGRVLLSLLGPLTYQVSLVSHAKSHTTEGDTAQRGCGDRGVLFGGSSLSMSSP